MIRRIKGSFAWIVSNSGAIGWLMATMTREQLAQIPYLDLNVVAGRSVLLMPLWDGTKWNQWMPGPDGKMIRMQMVDAILSHYLAKESARDDDLFLPFFDLMWQRASYPSMSKQVVSLSGDFHLMATSAAKLRHFHETRDRIDKMLIRSFVQSEIEYLITVARSVYDLLQEVIAKLWNGTVKLNDPAADRKRKSHPLHETFRRVVLENNQPRSAEAIVDRFALPMSMAELYVKYAPFFLSLRDMRDSIMHGGSTVDLIFVTERGFCVDPRMKPFSDFTWKEEHKDNATIVSLLPWVAHVVQEALGACTELMGAFANAVVLPPELAPGYRVFQRDPSNKVLLELSEVAEGKRIWWSDGPVASEVRQEEEPASNLDAKEGAA